MSAAKEFFTPQDQEDIKLAVMNAELDTSGEIRVHVENVCQGDVLDRAAFVFKNLDMHKTELRNGVLIYLAVKNRKFAIIGDTGINKVVPPNFWDDVKQEMLTRFRNNEFKRGLCEAIEEVGLHLKKYFPHERNDVNELPDDISFGDGYGKN
jgi:uncharacterized membrane protein